VCVFENAVEQVTNLDPSTTKFSLNGVYWQRDTKRTHNVEKEYLILDDQSNRASDEDRQDEEKDDKQRYSQVQFWLRGHDRRACGRRHDQRLHRGRWGIHVTLLVHRHLLILLYHRPFVHRSCTLVKLTTLFKHLLSEPQLHCKTCTIRLSMEYLSLRT